jgi:hypothetical protein
MRPQAKVNKASRTGPDRGTIIWSTIAALALGLDWWIIAIGVSCPSCGYNPVATGIPGIILFVLGIVAALIALVRAFRLARASRGQPTGLWLTLITLAAALICGGLLYGFWTADTGNELSHGAASRHIPPPILSHWGLTTWSLTLAITAVPLATLAIGLYWNKRLPLLTTVSAPLAALVALTVITAATAQAAGQSSGAPQLTLTETSAPAIDCARGTYSLVIVSNGGGGTLVWSAQADTNTPVTITPATGSLGPGQQQTVTVSGVFHSTSAYPAVIVTFTQHGSGSAGGSQSQAISFSC